MQSLVCIKPGQLEYKEMDEPILQKDHSILEIKRICVCGTNLHVFECTQPYIVTERLKEITQGNMPTAVIHATGSLIVTGKVFINEKGRLYCGPLNFRGGYRSRTGDLLHAMQTL